MIEMQNAKFYLEVLNLCNFLPMTFYEDVQVDGSRNQIRRGNMFIFLSVSPRFPSVSF